MEQSREKSSTLPDTSVNNRKESDNMVKNWKIKIIQSEGI